MEGIVVYGMLAMTPKSRIPVPEQVGAVSKVAITKFGNVGASITDYIQYCCRASVSCGSRESTHFEVNRPVSTSYSRGFRSFRLFRRCSTTAHDLILQALV